MSRSSQVQSAALLAATMLTMLFCAPVRADAPAQAVMPCATTDGATRAPHQRYPVQALKTRREGSVQLQVVVNSEGGADKVVVRTSSGSSDLDKAARVTARGAQLCLLDGRTQAKPGLAVMRVDFKITQLVAGR